MLEVAFLNKLKEKYDYDEKTMSAITKILPCIISYFGEEYETIILEAVLNTKIIPCNSKQTISKIVNEKKTISLIGESFLGDIDLKKGESVYFPDIKIKYNEDINSYEIEKVDRIIATSHTFNYDSPKGLEVLTHALLHLVKSYYNEFEINENTITIRNGISYETRKIIYGEEIKLELIDEFGKGLEEGFNILDTELIVSMVLHDSYKCYDYDSVYMIAYTLKEKYKLINEINSYEITGDIEAFKKSYKKENIEKLAQICDECIEIENDMHMSYTREDKDRISNVLKEKLENDAYNALISVYKTQKINSK